MMIVLSAVTATQFAWIGVIIFSFGIYQMIQRNKGKVTFSKPGWIITTGFILNFLLIMIFTEPVEETSSDVKKDSTIKQEQTDASQLAEEEKKQEEAARLAEEQKAQEEAARLAEEQKAQEEATRLAEEQKAQEEAARLAEEQKAQEEAARLAEEQKVQEAATFVSYKNCDAVRAAGAAPIYEGQPGYSKKLDRDGDGIACDR